MIMFNLLKLWKLEKENKQLRETLDSQALLIDKLFQEISRRDQKIAEQQKRMRFFGIQIGNEESDPDKLDFPSTIKL